MAFPSIQVLPQPACGQCDVSVYKELIHEDSYGYIRWHSGRLVATPAPGWAFDHWEWQWSNDSGYQETFTSTSNPFEGPYYVWVRADRWYPYDVLPGTDGTDKLFYYGEQDYHYPGGSGTPAYDIVYGVEVVDWIKAYFVPSGTGTGLPIYDTTNGMIMCGRDFTVLYDDGTTDDEVGNY